MIDNHVRTDFLDRILRQTRLTFRRRGVELTVFLADFVLLMAVGLPALVPGAIAAVFFAVRFVRSYLDLGRAYSTLEGVYRREDAQCRPWG